MSERSASLPRSLFGQDSTAEEVTAGLDLTGKTALVTGCSAGIGYETMRVLVMRGALVYGVGRSMEKTQRACGAVSASGAKGNALPFICEQADFSSVAACADAVKKLGTPVDILICNAGVYSLPKLELAEGLEKQFVINHLSHFILVNRLLGLVQSAPRGRIVVVASAAAYVHAPEAGIEFDNLSGQRYYDAGKMYGQSKLANVLFARELAHRLSGTRATANSLDPGWVMTETMREQWVRNHLDPEDAKVQIGERWVSAKSPEQGAATTCYVATHPSLEGVSGEYFADNQMPIPPKNLRDDAMAKKLWAVSEEFTRPHLIQ